MSKMDTVYGKTKDNYRAKIVLKSTILFIWFVILTIICLFPIYILLVNATLPHKIIANGITFLPGSNLFNNYKIVTSADYRLNYRALFGYRNSLIITCSSCFLTVFFSALTAYGIHVYDFKLKEIS